VKHQADCKAIVDPECGPCTCPAPSALSREQVESRIHWYGGENYHLYRDRWADELLGHDTAQRQALAQQAQEIERLTKTLALSSQQAVEHFARTQELDQQRVAAMEKAEAAHAWVAYTRKEIERVKRELGKAQMERYHWEGIALGTQPDAVRLVAQLAAMTRERDICKRQHDIVQAENERFRGINAKLQARVQELELDVTHRDRTVQEHIAKQQELQATLTEREARIAELEALLLKSEQRMNDIMSNTRLLRREFDMWEARLAELRSDD